MKANELRIGNYVFDVMDRENITFTLDDFQCLNNYRRSNQPNTVYKPIPLTKEWLLKFGFEKEFNVGCSENDEDAWYWSDKSIDLTNSLELSNSDRCYDSMPVNGSQKIEYIHQLQNLYFALTGEELKCIQ